MEAHEADVRRIADEVKGFHTRGEPFRIFHGSTNSTRPPHGQSTVDISALSRVLHIDLEARTAIVEPSVPMDRLVDATLPLGLVPPVVMEFPGITVGGGFAGSAGESSSFRHGGFHSIITSIEMVLATGEVVTASSEERPDLFRAASGALGTLGIVTKLEMRLIPAGKYVELVYHSYSSAKEGISALQRETKDPDNDFVEGIVFSRTCTVVITGRMTDDLASKDSPSRRPQTFTRPNDPWYYLHVRNRVSSPSPPSLSSPSPRTDLVPLRDYLFRYDRGGFWMGEVAFGYARVVPFNRLTRRLLNRIMNTRALFRAGLGGGSRMTFRYLVHDLSLPYATVGNFIDYVADTLDIWPLWLCPLPPIQQPTFHPSSTTTTTATADEDQQQSQQPPQLGHRGRDAAADPVPTLNVGVWGEAKGSDDLESFVRVNRDLETTLRQLGGRKVLYSHAYYTEDEFWSIYDREWYDGLREKYRASTLPTVYDKVKVDVDRERRRRGILDRLAVSWPLAGLIGVASALRS
ncbi:FAD binding domain-containing protein [Sodiomyces alkalinus F11]|uniref:Delta(24)-sterol reductase n=1 Tax=Sodiomyces alkalinus (strain CBS 110278 / VKM F-3762 / F11) TaxID=1314773 RepID=A0A3N2Q6Q8_SODAK|nr:FAD binding domain-containing protein [Sodiomyces alkalinus F11]ROT42396.1 FAD binding domain-containing protein [Sodiomyces alkalinus F11]